MSIPIKNMPLWQVILMPLIAVGIFSLLVIYYPPGPSPISTWVGVLLPILGTIGAIITARTEFVWGRPLFLHAFLLNWYAFGLRAIHFAYPMTLGWVLVLLVPYILAWSMPFIHPVFKKYFHRGEPVLQKKNGLEFTDIVLRLLAPISGAGAVLGLYASDFGMENFASAIVGFVMIILVIVMAQSFSYQVLDREETIKES